MRHASSPLTLAVWAAAGVLFLTTDDTRAAETSSALTGQWSSAETPDEKKERLRAIAELTERMPHFQQRQARSRLSDRTSPRPSVVLEIEDSAVILASGDRRVELELGAPPIEVSSREGRARVNAKMEGPRLIVVSRTGKGKRTTAYRADGAHLWVEVTMTGTHLAGPLRYVSTYARME